MNNLTVRFNEQDYIATYNPQSGFYELDLQTPNEGGVYEAEISFTDLFGELFEEIKPIQIWNKEPVKIETNKVFMWIFSYEDFSVKDIVEISDYEINIDEETNAKTIINVLKQINAKSRDYIVIKKNNEIMYWGTIQEVQNENGKQLYQYTVKYITNLFDREIKLENENIIRTTGIEDFIKTTINNNFINNTDSFINKNYLEVVVESHTPKQTSVTNVENGIYNLHTWMTNCTQNYDIVYSFSIVNKKLRLTIKNNSYSRQLIDTKAQAISNYQEVFETDFVSKVTVLTSTNTYELYLLSDRTTTTNPLAPNRVDGKVTTVYTEDYEDAPQMALNVMKANSYNHNITFNLYDKYIPVGTPISIKTKESIILDTYISSITITPKKFIQYTCGNIRIKFIDKLLKERKN
jgi:hypothetical protein